MPQYPHAKDATMIDTDFLSLSELTPEEKRQIYFMRTGHTQDSLAELACVSAVSMNRYCRTGEMPEHRHAALVRAGIPPEILPAPVPYRIGTQPPKGEETIPAL